MPENGPALVETVIEEVTGEPSAVRAVKLLQLALERGWQENPYASLVLRLKHPSGLPMFVRWDLALTGTGKRSWRFQGARAANGQQLNLGDVAAVIENPELVFPEPPADLLEEGTENDCTD